MKNTILIILFSAIGLSLSAQRVQISLQMHGGIIAGSNTGFYSGGKAWQAEYVFGHQKMQYLLGIEQRAVQWGNELSLRTGLVYDIYQKNKHSGELTGILHQGAALFKQKSLYALGMEFMYLHQWQIKPKWGFLFGTGMRLSTCPAYGEYSTISTVFEIPLKTGFYF